MPTPIKIAYYSVRYYHIYFGKEPDEIYQVPYGHPAPIEACIAQILRKRAPELEGYADEIWASFDESKLKTAWSFITTWEEIQKRAKAVQVPGKPSTWNLQKDGLLGAPRALIKSHFGPGVFDKHITDSAFMYFGYDPAETVLWVVWVNKDGRKFTDADAKNLMIVAKRGGSWEASERTVRKKKDQVIKTIGKTDIHFTHYEGAGASKTADGFAGAQVSGQKQVIAYRSEYLFNPDGNYPWK